MFTARKATGSAKGGAADAYQRKKAAAAARSARESEAGRDIAPLPAVVNPKRREKACKSLLEFCKYFPERFSLEFSPDHIEVINTAQEVIERGGTTPIAMPRGFGKTQICITACEWATMTGRRKYLPLVGANLKAAKRLIETIKKDLLTNALLFEDFPEVCYPIRRMDDRANRCKGQRLAGAKTWMVWEADRIVLPTVAGSAASSAVILVSSLNSTSLRGSNFSRAADGQVVRPDLVILDDVQDDRIAANPIRVEKVLETINGTVLGMAGPDSKIAVLAPCTVIRPDDVADQLLDRKRNPDWCGKIYKLVYEMPSNMTLWDEYAHIRAESLRADGTIKAATEFYRQHRAEMDAGARVAWEARFQDGELSAIQHAMNLYYRNPATFAAEYNNAPLVADEAKVQLNREDLLVSRLNGLNPMAVPAWATHLVAHIDLQKTLLYWMVCAFADDFTGAVIDYGAWPDQKRRYFTLGEAPRPFSSVIPGARLDGQIRQALESCVDELVAKTYLRDGGAPVSLQRVGVDTGFKQDPIYDWARTSKHRPIVLPTRGLAIGVKNKPLAEYFRKPGDRYGYHWRIPSPPPSQVVRTLQIDTNFWKSFVADRLRLAVGDRGAITFYGKRGADHRMLADHLTAEKCFPLRLDTGRELEEWAIKPGKPDNHYWDTLVGCAAIASHEGATVLASETEKPKPRKKFRSYDEWRRDRFGGGRRS